MVEWLSWWSNCWGFQPRLKHVLLIMNPSPKYEKFEGRLSKIVPRNLCSLVSVRTVLKYLPNSLCIPTMYIHARFVVQSPFISTKTGHFFHLVVSKKTHLHTCWDERSILLLWHNSKTKLVSQCTIIFKFHITNYLWDFYCALRVYYVQFDYINDHQDQVKAVLQYS